MAINETHQSSLKRATATQAWPVLILLLTPNRGRAAELLILILLLTLLISYSYSQRNWNACSVLPTVACYQTQAADADALPVPNLNLI